MQIQKMEPETKEAVGAVTPATSNPESNPVDQDKAAGAETPVAETPPGGNTPVPPEEASADKDAGAGGDAVSAAPVTAPATAADESATQQPEAVVTALPAVHPTTSVQPLNGRLPVTALKAHADNEKTYGAGGSVADLEKSIGK